MLATATALFDIARIEAGIGADQFGPVDLGRVAADVAELYEAAAEEQGVRLVATAEPGLVVRGHDQLLALALSNLVDNALRHAPQGGAIDRRRAARRRHARRSSSPTAAPASPRPTASARSAASSVSTPAAAAPAPASASPSSPPSPACTAPPSYSATTPPASSSPCASPIPRPFLRRVVHAHDSRNPVLANDFTRSRFPPETAAAAARSSA